MEDMAVGAIILWVVAVLFWWVLAFVTSAIAHRKGRSSVGWFFIALIFPIAILFALIAGKEGEGRQGFPPTIWWSLYPIFVVVVGGIIVLLGLSIWAGILFATILFPILMWFISKKKIETK